MIMPTNLKMSRRYLFDFIMVAMVIISSCGSSETYPNHCNVVSVDIDRATDFVSTRTILDPSHMDIVRLSGDNITIGLVKSFKVNNDKFYILNENGSAIYIFGKSGALESVIDRYGNAGNEYSDITDFCADGENIYILDQNKEKVHHLLTDGRYVSNTDISSIWGNQIFTAEGNVYVINNGSDTELGKYHLFRIDDGHIEPMLPFTTASGIYMRQNHSGNHVFIRETNTLYEIKDGEPKELLTLDFGDLSLPEELTGADAIELLKNKALDKYVLGVDKVESDGRRILFFCDVKSRPKVIVYDLDKREIVDICSGFKNDMFLGVGLGNYTLAEGNVYDFYYADELCTVLDYSDDSVLSAEYKEMKHQLRSELTPEDNPIIFRYEMLR